LPGDTISADSENNPTTADLKNPSSVMNRLFYAMKGKSFFMKVNNEGEVTAVEGLDAIGRTLLEGTDLDSQSRQKALQAFSSQFNKEAVREMFSNSFYLFPDKPIKVGDSWDKTSYMGPLKVGITTTYTVKDIEGHVVTLDAKSKTSLKGNEGEQTSTLVVDARTGLMINGNFHHALKGNAFNISVSGTVRGKEL
jgi:hypothetical protein